MSSILTNSSAMVALQTLKTINSSLSDTQSQISTGKKVANATDNSAVWAISKVMESDVEGFNSISESLSLGQSTVAVARQASETVTDLLTEMKGKIVAAQEDNVDRGKLNADVSALKDQIDSVVGAAQFNGLNLVDGSASSASVLASLDRDASGGVSASSISVTAQNLSTGGYTAKAAFTGSDGVAADSADAFGFSLDGTGGTTDSGTVVIADPTYAEGDKITLRLGDEEVSYTVTADDAASSTTEDIVAVGLKAAIEATGSNLTVDYDSANPGELVITNDSTDSIQISGQFTNANSGGLGALASIDVSSSAGATAALGAIETLIDTAIDASSAFGSVEGRINTQSEFVSKLTDSLKTGIGSLVDADMEETSARLQALQVQQQLATQSLSIANQAPQSILSLFR
ncbi:flagellin [Shimia thalassica]|uniref:flagellin n=1 Tax=Shimia thalassica TaxID=1715693 RepID=UPI000C07F0DE|nr:flagellin [Shimia thalassica]PHO05495.1 flagellin [Rhodobacteraceae bacterium 4F10]MBU2942359.1 flagellin [Shimia thalassica]MDO6479769.1 flagellin [Shimia thalassica]MDO6485459.1 flagellin [Shimia thalassica]MDO6504287.1 flagellin [Shimia thalassica]